MTTVQTTVDLELAVSAATAAIAVLPAAEPLTAGAPRPGDAAADAGFAGAVVADLDGRTSARLTVLVGPELVSALAASPIGDLDLAAALQPSLDAAATALGARSGAARQVDPDTVVDEIAEPFVIVPLEGSDVVAALLVPEALLAHPADDTPALPTTSAAAPTGDRRGIEMLHGVDMEVTVEIGRARMTVRELLDLAPGAVLELDRAAGSPADLLVNGRLIARGEVVVIDEDFGLRITEIVTDSTAG
ncbi:MULTISPECIES: flagellar motor switch protein FliN [unclassified Nocardioides]|uniref:flagellar motor switch protein FliN n=1 Tax=unclassified Nocardioides TaxID=2615069 RepID=UPI00005703B1|nr:MULTISPECIES: flagellar motor switch protein FliN [unclassified Nocardioides]ABL80270.1 flagellar motor switch protein FliN [Nocardioides sp. JS614]